MSSQQYYAEIKRVENVDTPDEQYRFNNDNNLVTMTVPLAGIGSWCSTVGSGIFEFYESLGLERTIVNIKGPDGTVELLGGKYTIYNEKQESGSLVSTVESDEGNIYIYENEDVLPIGFTQDIYMLKSDFLELDPELRALAMIKALVVEDDMESEVKSVLREYDPAEDGVISSENKVNDIREHLQEKGENFNRSGKGFSLTMTADSDKSVSYTHLDVYKRQVRAVIHSFSRKVTPAGGHRSCLYIKAVSYTHLDVYKRQSHYRPIQIYIFTGIQIQVKSSSQFNHRTDISANQNLSLSRTHNSCNYFKQC